MGLAEALIRAQTGYRSDVAALKQQLAKTEIFIPLADTGAIPGGYSTLAKDASVSVHNLRSADGTAWVPLFSDVGGLTKAGEQNGWKTGHGSLQYLKVNAMTVLDSMFLPALESGANAGVVFDVGQRSELAMMANEVLQLIKGEPIPLIDYASKQPARGNEQVMIGWPAEAPSQELQEAIAAVLRAEKSIKSYALRQVFIPERDVSPHLLLDIAGEIPEPDRRRISQSVGAAVSGIKMSPPGYLDVAYNFADNTAPRS